MVVYIDLPQKNQNQDGRQKTKWQSKHKIDYNLFNFQPRSSRFCIVVYIDIPQEKFKTKMAAKKQNGPQTQN